MPGLDTQVLFAFNPRDKHHRRALRLLEAIKSREIRNVYVTDTVLLEFIVVMKARGFPNQMIIKALLALQRIFFQNNISYKKTLSTSVLIDALLFMEKGATFFDALIAASIKSIDNTVISSDKIYERLNLVIYEF